MIYLVIGKENSGKSVFAEELAVGLGDRQRIYLATMKIYDDAGQERVKKHRKQRDGKGFITVEQEYDICGVIDKVKVTEPAVILLECVSNLVGNELHENIRRMDRLTTGVLSEDGFACEISAEIKKLAEYVSDLIIVTNEYESVGDGYDDDTRRYVRMLDLVNEKMIAYSDKIFDLRKDS